MTSVIGTQQDIKSFPDLPIELCYLIIEFAAHDNLNPNDTVRFMSVCKALAFRFEPILYRTLFIGGPRVFSLAIAALTRLEKRRPGFGAMYVRNLWIFGDLPQMYFPAICRLCPRIACLALGGKTVGIEIQPGLRPTELHFNHFWDNYFDFRVPIYQNVSHLDLGDISRNEEIAKQLHLLPRLTHLAITVYDILPTFRVVHALVEEALAVLPALRMVLLELFKASFEPASNMQSRIWLAFDCFARQERVVRKAGMAQNLFIDERRRRMILGKTIWCD